MKNTDLARQLYKSLNGDRSKVVKALQDAGMTWAGANTYYSVIHGEKLQRQRDRQAAIAYALQPANLFLGSIFIIGVVSLLALTLR